MVERGKTWEQASAGSYDLKQFVSVLVQVFYLDLTKSYFRQDCVLVAQRLLLSVFEIKRNHISISMLSSVIVS